jgi:signal peptidase II
MKIKVVKFLLLVLMFLAGCAADQASKRWIVRSGTDWAPVVILSGYLDFSYTENRGMVFGMLNHSDSVFQRYGLTAVQILSILFILIIIRQISHFSFFRLAPFFLILSGAFGNLIDKIRMGHVVDFIHIHLRDKIDWPFLFNLADLWICLGGFWLLILILFDKKELHRDKTS